MGYFTIYVIMYDYVINLRYLNNVVTTVKFSIKYFLIFTLLLKGKSIFNYVYDSWKKIVIFYSHKFSLSFFWFLKWTKELTICLALIGYWSYAETWDGIYYILLVHITVQTRTYEYITAAIELRVYIICEENWLCISTN